MVAFLLFLLNLLGLPFKSKSQLAAENAALRQQIIVLQRKVRGRVQLTDSDRRFFIQLYRWFPSVLNAITIVQPETLLRWHREGFRHYWRWKSRNCGGRPPISAELRALIRRMSLENKLWGAPPGEWAGGISPPASRRTERETLASLGSHQANVPVMPIRQCTKRSACSRASLWRKRPARLLAAKRLNFRLTQSRSVRLMYRNKGYRADGAYRP